MIAHTHFSRSIFFTFFHFLSAKPLSDVNTNILFVMHLFENSNHLVVNRAVFVNYIKEFTNYSMLQ